MSICSLPSVPCKMSWTNAICLPSGDQWPSKCGRAAFANNGLRSEPSLFMVHRPILPAWMRVKRNRLPSGDHWRCWMKSRIEEILVGGGDCAVTVVEVIARTTMEIVKLGRQQKETREQR